MNRKTTFPFLALIAAAVLFFWVKSNQRGKNAVTADKANTAYTELRSGNKPVQYSRHALCRMDCRHIDKAEVNDILQNGTVNFSKIEEDNRGRTYPLEGVTKDGQHVRIVFAPHEKDIVVVTAIDLDSDVDCGDCK